MQKTFDQLIEESFGQSSHLDVVDLRTLYYGRPNLYVAFTDDGDYDTEGDDHTYDRPEGIICYKLEDVVGKKVGSSMFYANVFRIKSSQKKFIEDIRYYRKEDLNNDLAILRLMNTIKQDALEEIITFVLRDTTIRFDFIRMWTITEFIAKTKNKRNYDEVWRDILLTLGYSGFSDPSKTGQMLGTRTPSTIFIDYEKKIDLDILPIQKYRDDPRNRVEDKVERKRKKLRGSRNRISKRRT